MSDQLRMECRLEVIRRMLETPRSNVYARERAAGARAAEAADVKLQAHIEHIAAQWPTYGYRSVTAQLRREGEDPINGKRVRRLMSELGVVGNAPPRRLLSLHPT